MKNHTYMLTSRVTSIHVPWNFSINFPLKLKQQWAHEILFRLSCLLKRNMGSVKIGRKMNYGTAQSPSFHHLPMVHLSVHPLVILISIHECLYSSSSSIQKLLCMCVHTCLEDLWTWAWSQPTWTMGGVPVKSPTTVRSKTLKGKNVCACVERVHIYFPCCSPQTIHYNHYWCNAYATLIGLDCEQSTWGLKYTVGGL